MINPHLILLSLALLTHADPTSNVPTLSFETITVYPRNLIARDEQTSNVPLSFETITVYPRNLMARDSTTTATATIQHHLLQTAKLEPRATLASLPNGAEVESGEGIRRKAIGADFAPVLESGGVRGRGVHAAMVSRTEDI
jgi:hypothetical protein